MTLGKKLPISHFTRDLDKLSKDLRSGTDAGKRLRPNFGKLALLFLLGDSISCLRHLTTFRAEFGASGGHFFQRPYKTYM